jgi:hypothetical protein
MGVLHLHAAINPTNATQMARTTVRGIILDCCIFFFLLHGDGFLAADPDTSFSAQSYGGQCIALHWTG